MKKKFIKSTLILIIGGFITKILGLIIKIVLARIISTETLGLYMMIIPTFFLLLNLSQFGFPLAISKLVAENKKNNKKIIFSIIPVSLIINIIIIITIVVISPFIASNLLHDNRCQLGLIAMAIVLPFSCIGSIIRSYFFGKEKMLPNVIANIFEDSTKLLLLIIFAKFLKSLSISYAVALIILLNVISELISILVLVLFLPKNTKIKKSDLKPNKNYLKDTMDISIPTTTSKLIASLGYFLEPIIITNSLLQNGYSNNYIIHEYAVISGYVLPLLLLPSFFIINISQVLLPIISNNYATKNYKSIKKSLKLALVLSLMIGIPITISIIMFPKLYLSIIFHTTKGIPYLKFLAPIFIFQYISILLTATLDAINKSKDNLYITFIGIIIRTGLLWLLPIFKLGIWSLIIATSCNIIVTSLLAIKKVCFYLKQT